MTPFASRAGLAVALAALWCAPAAAQDTPPSQVVDLSYDTGPVQNSGSTLAVVASFPVNITGAEWLRLHFSEVTLSGDVLAGTGSILRITSLYDGAEQTQNAIHAQQWQNTSAYFNGASVLVEVLAHPGTGESRVVLSHVVSSLSGAPESICGPTDDRVLSSDPRAGRLLPVGCTGWIINDCNSCQLTAGHCSTSPGSLDVLQFNVPLSTSSGTIQHPPPQDQYSVDDTSTQSNGGGGVGNDYAYFGCFPNSVTGFTPFQAQAARFTLTTPPTFNNQHDIRITGYGTRSSPASWNQVQETHAGAWVTFNSTTLQYTADTTGGNSGSPVIHEPTGNAIGIHTHGGCGSSGGQNSGTGANHPGLQTYLGTPKGVCASGVSVVGNVPTTVSTTATTPVTVQTGGTIVPGTVTLHYSYDGGPFNALAMTPAGPNQHSGALPAATCDSTPRFYFSVQDASCGILTAPNGAPANFYTATVAAFEVTLRSENFESNTGWTTSISGATSGAWQRGVPVNDSGWAYDPAADFDGSGQCWLTENAPGNTDVDNGSVTLISPALDLAGGEVIVRYAYYLYLTVVDGNDKLLVEMSSNGLAGPWATVANHTTNGGTSWRTHQVSNADILGAGLSFSSDMRIRFTAMDIATQSIVEAGVDAFQIVRASCSQFENYCTSGANGSVLSASGSASVAANDLALHASNVPSNKSGLFFYATTKQNTPFGLGTRCVAAPANRLPIATSGAGTTLDIAVDYNALPASGPIQAGDLWNFQCWFRAGGGQSDLSDGLQIIFAP
jgi:V8-like Glu-specific endopeptidase